MQSLREPLVFELSSETIALRYLKLVSVPSICPLPLISLWMPLAMFAYSLVFSLLIFTLYLVLVLSTRDASSSFSSGRASTSSAVCL